MWLYLRGEPNESMERAYDYKSKANLDNLGNFQKKIGKNVAKNAVKKLTLKKLKHVNVMFYLIRESRLAFSLIYLTPFMHHP